MKRLLTFSVLLLAIACGRRDINNDTSLFSIKEFGQWGYMNQYGTTLIPCQFHEAKLFSEGFAAVRIDSLWGFINTKGKYVITPKFYEAEDFSDGLSKVTLKSDSGIVNAFITTNGEVAFIPPDRYVSPFAYGRATVEINDEVCVIDKSGKIVFNTHYPYGGGSPLQEGIVHVWSSDSTRYYDINGNLLLQLEGMGHNNFNNGLALVRINNDACFINIKGEVKIKLEKPDLTYFDFSDGMAEVVIPATNHGSGFVDATGKIVISTQYDLVGKFKEGLASFLNEDGWGFINKEGKVVITPHFEEVDYNGFSNGLCWVKHNHRWGYINTKGDFIWQVKIGHEYEQLDLSKWKIDTLETNQPLYADKYAGYDNFPRRKIFPSSNQLILKIDTIDLTVFSDRYLGYKLYLINATKDTVSLPLQDGRIKIIQQGKNKSGDWQDIDNFINSFCGNSYHTMKLAPDEFQIFATPLFKGQFKTRLRFMLKLGKREIYSNEYVGQINYGQLLNPKDKDRTRVSVWAN